MRSIIKLRKRHVDCFMAGDTDGWLQAANELRKLLVKKQRATTLDTLFPIPTKLTNVPSTRSFKERSREGYLLVDHRAAPGLPKDMSCLPVGEGTLIEAATLTCRHCPSVVIRNPLRTRDRGYCMKCMHYICDLCAVAYTQSGICRPWAQVVDDVKDGKTATPVLARDLHLGSS